MMHFVGRLRIERHTSPSATRQCRGYLAVTAWAQGGGGDDVVMGKIQQVGALRLAERGEGCEAGGGPRQANGGLSCGRRKAWAAGGGRMSSGHLRHLWRPKSGLRRGRLAFREASQAPGLWVHGRETRTHANRTIDIVSQVDPTARGLTGDVDPLTARDIRQLSYVKD